MAKLKNKKIKIKRQNMYKNNKLLKTSFLYTGLVFILYACAQEPEQPEIKTDIQVLLADIDPSDVQQQLDKIQIKESELPTSNNFPPVPINNDIASNNSNTNDPVKLEFNINQEICRDSMVTYKVADESGYINSHTAKAQAQAVIIKVNNKQIKLMISGWYSRNKNLFNWQPYLKQQPVMGLMKLEKGKVYWDDKANWYLCSFDAGEMI
ncbi:hypothetical protein RI844_17940 [Thalassotalea fonticola]|uniref:Lipoprotein n=1 Tax=Thalassotalea fonticola TaxID=3065649 RepID=A0ABZ0GMW0_9GAMM|nr:hypothetical protein RI844_17940 [Colwelliaceae bacterium S1-1]